MKEQSLTWIEDHFDKIKYFASPNPIWNLIFLTPITFMLALCIGQDWVANHLLATLSLFSIGFIFWTFLEYAIHRWIYHGQYKNKTLRRFVESFHMYHHRNMDDSRVLNAGPLMIIPLSFIILVPLFLVFQNTVEVFAIIGLGLLSAYYFYEWVHYLIHKPKITNRYLIYITRFHMFHHQKRWNKNFGNTNHFWDYLLGTYDSGYKKIK